MTDVKAENLSKFVKGVEDSMHIIGLYEQSRPGSIAFTKLEEAILWAQVMIGQINLKKDEETEVKDEAKIGEVIPAA